MMHSIPGGIAFFQREEPSIAVGIGCTLAEDTAHQFIHAIMPLPLFTPIQFFQHGGNMAIFFLLLFKIFNHLYQQTCIRFLSVRLRIVQAV